MAALLPNRGLLALSLLQLVVVLLLVASVVEGKKKHHGNSSNEDAAALQYPPRVELLALGTLFIGGWLL
jgi:hypothetical protein